MGLDTSHNCWHGAYSAFARFRARLAQSIGMDLSSMRVFEQFGASEFGEELPSNEKEPLCILLNHSDCDGVIEHKDTLPLANRLKEILVLEQSKAVSSDDFENNRYLERIQQFIDGLMDAHNNNEDVDFH